MAIILIVAAIIAVAVIVVIFIRSKKSPNDEPLYFIEQDSLGMKDVISYFKTSEVFEMLKQDNNLLAVAVRDNIGDSNIKIVLTIFDKQKGEITENPLAKAYRVKALDEDLHD